MSKEEIGALASGLHIFGNLGYEKVISVDGIITCGDDSIEEPDSTTLAQLGWEWDEDCSEWFFLVDRDVSSIPCGLCGGDVIEFSIPNDIWNRVIRKKGEEQDVEYLCSDCWFNALREALLITSPSESVQVLVDRLDNENEIAAAFRLHMIRFWSYEKIESFCLGFLSEEAKEYFSNGEK